MKNDATKIKYFLYARKSSESEDKQMASIDSQIKELTKLAQNNGLNIVAVLSESKSAKTPEQRPVFNQMIERVKRGEANGIICWKLNRLARNPVDGGLISWMLQENKIKHIFTFGRNYYPTDNVIVMAVELGMANQFVRDLSVDTARGLRNKAERGWYPTKPSLGYIHNPFKKKGEKEIMEDPERFGLVRKMFDLMLTGAYTPPKILRKAVKEWGLTNKQGGKVSRSNLYRIFSDTFYYGEFEYPKNSGNWFKGKHTPMIAKEEFEKIQLLLGREHRAKTKRHTFPFTGFIRCGECGALVTAENKIKRQKNGNIHFYTFYHCTKRKNPNCTQRSIRKELLEDQIKELLEKIEIPKEFCEWAMEIIRQENKQESKARESIIVSQQKAYNECVRKIDNLIDMRANGELSEEEFKRKKSELELNKARYKELIDSSDKDVNDWLDKADSLFDFAEHAKERFEKGNWEIKREIAFFLGSNFSLKDKKLSVTIQKPLQLLEEASKEAKLIQARFEPLGSGLNKRTLGDLYAQSPVMLRERDSNPRPSG